MDAPAAVRPQLLATFWHPFDAMLAQSLLAAAGVESWLEDEHMARLDLLQVSAIGGIRLVVPAAHVEQALAALVDSPARRDVVARLQTRLPAPRPQLPPDADADDFGTCPTCGSTRTWYGPFLTLPRYIVGTIVIAALVVATRVVVDGEFAPWRWDWHRPETAISVLVAFALWFLDPLLFALFAGRQWRCATCDRRLRFRAFALSDQPALTMQIRPEKPSDVDAIREINLAAFGQPAEGALVDALRTSGDALLSLVALGVDDGSSLVGHILFSRVQIVRDGAPPIAAVSLAPMAVRPLQQRQGVGSALLRDGLDRLRARGERIVIVLGHPDYYPRFGFSPALAANLQSAYSGAGDAWMALDLEPGALDGVSGRVIYPAAFESV